MRLYAYTLNAVSGEITETVVEVQEKKKTYKVERGYIPGAYTSLVRKADMPYINNAYVSTEREPEEARKLFMDRTEWKYTRAVEEAGRLKALKTAIENCQIKEAEP